MPPRACKTCGVPFIGPGWACPEHAPADFGRGPSNPLYRSAAWKHLRARLIARHVAQYGWWCPGWQRPGHAANVLSLDHVVGLAQGGAPLAESNLRVLCSDCNGRKGLHDRRVRRR